MAKLWGEEQPIRERREPALRPQSRFKSFSRREASLGGRLDDIHDFKHLVDLGLVITCVAAVVVIMSAPPLRLIEGIFCCNPVALLEPTDPLIKPAFHHAGPDRFLRLIPVLNSVIDPPVEAPE